MTAGTAQIAAGLAALALLGLATPGQAEAESYPAWLRRVTGCQDITGLNPFVDPVFTFRQGEYSTVEAPGAIGEVDLDRQSVMVSTAERYSMRLLVADYTPFLHGYAALVGRTHDPILFPAPGVSATDRIVRTVRIHVLSGNEPVRFATVLFNSGVFDGDPYEMQADADGVIVVNCFQTATTRKEVFVTTDTDEGTGLLSLRSRSFDGSEDWVITRTADPPPPPDIGHHHHHHGEAMHIDTEPARRPRRTG